MSKISVILGCCLSSEEMAEFIEEHPAYFEENTPKNDDGLKNDDERLIVKTEFGCLVS